MKNIVFGTLMLFLIACIACEKNKKPKPDNQYGLPNATQTGAGVFACLKNGQIWVSKTGTDYMNANISDTSFGVGGRQVPVQLVLKCFQ